MHYYRYRASNELSIKEFMYNEIYFSSTSECNDPFDGKIFVSFEADKEKWNRLLHLAWEGVNNANKPSWEENLSVHLAGLSPIAYEDALKFDYAGAMLALSSPPDLKTAFILSEYAKRYLRLYVPNNMYFVSFSKEYKDILMWSHYASMHRGYCLIFNAIDGRLYQDQQRKKTTISRNTRYGIAPSMSLGIPDSFPFQDISYDPDSTSYSAFSYFPKYVWGEKLDEQEIKEFIDWQSRQYLVKHNCWRYEQESRLTISPDYAWLFRENIEFTKQERLFHYMPNQLVGVILGACMDVQQKMRFRELIQEHMERIARNPGDNFPIFDFVLFQAILPGDRREVIIKPEEIVTLTRTLQKTDSDFERILNEWREGSAMVINGSSATKKKFL